jgi:hypothetical protein
VTKHTRRSMKLLFLAMIVLWLLGGARSNSIVVIRGPTGWTVIEYEGPGPHIIEHKSTDGSLSVRSGWGGP